MKNPSKIKNKVKRTQVYQKYKAKRLRDEKEKEREELGDLAPPRQLPKTIENTRIKDETMLRKDEVDEEIVGDERDDEFSRFFSNDTVRSLRILLVRISMCVSLCLVVCA